MVDQNFVRNNLKHSLSGVDIPFLQAVATGKVRDIYRHDSDLFLVTTDRLSGFDRILGLVPFKGQVLNQLSAYWFDQTSDIIGNHLLSVPDPNVSVVRPCTPLPVEVVVRGYITGVTSTALWYRYSQGERTIYGLAFPDGLRKNDPLPEPIITPTTKARGGGHDERITSRDVVQQGLVPADIWRQVSTAALSVFRRGQEVARAAGLILVDTKYEFGLSSDGEVLLIDEVHTPDSSRYWIGDTYADRLAAGIEPENYDKEFIRLYYVEHGYRGEGEPMALPADLAVQASLRYIRTYEMLTREPFEAGELPAGPRINRNLHSFANIR